MLLFNFTKSNDFSLYGAYQNYYFIGEKFYASYLFYKKLSPPQKEPKYKRTRAWKALVFSFWSIFGKSTKPIENEEDEFEIEDLEKSKESEQEFRN